MMSLLERSASYRKRSGNLQVFDNRVNWEPLQPSESQTSVCLPLTDIKSQMVSAQGSKQALLKLTTNQKSPDSYVFEFIRDGKPDFVSRDEVKDAISRQLARLKTGKDSSGTTEQTGKESQVTKVSVSPEEAKRRLEVLRKRPELQKLHMSLVGGGLISDAQFWKGVWFRLNESEQRWLNNEQEQDSVKQKRGISSEILSEISPVEEKGKTVKYRLTQDIIHKIFLEEPAVHLAYQNYVPSKMSEQAFWTQYFQSRYIHQGRKSEEAEKNDIFTPFEAQIERNKNWNKETLKNVEKEINLLLDDNPYQNGYGINEHDMNDQTREVRESFVTLYPVTKLLGKDPSLPLLERLNRHSSLVVEASNTSSYNPSKEDLYSTLTEERSLQTQQQQQLFSSPYSFLPSVKPKSRQKVHNCQYLGERLRSASESLQIVEPSIKVSRSVLQELFENI